MINLDDRILADLTEKELWLLIHLARRIKADRVCWPSNKRILEDTRWKDERTLAAVKKSLIEKGLLRQSTRTRDDGSQASNEYTILTNMIAVWMGANTLQETVAQNAPTPPHEMYPPQVQNVQGGEGHKMHPLEVLTSEVLTSEEENVVFDENDALSPVEEIIFYLNAKTGAKYRPTTKDYIKSINARLKEKYTVDDFKQVVDFKVAQWLNDPKMSEYLRPSTLFIPKHFDEYLNAPKIISPRANTDAALRDCDLPPDVAERYAAYMAHTQEAYPALWNSATRIFSHCDYLDYWENRTIPAIQFHLTAQQKRSIMLQVHTELNASEHTRKRYAKTIDAYHNAIRQAIKQQPIKI